LFISSLSDNGRSHKSQKTNHIRHSTSGTYFPLLNNCSIRLRAPRSGETGCSC
jgi:hypothetical protein